jgi:hypothetical protein
VEQAYLQRHHPHPVAVGGRIELVEIDTFSCDRPVVASYKRERRSVTVDFLAPGD